jgi:hypothetical protein
VVQHPTTTATTTTTTTITSPSGTHCNTLKLSKSNTFPSVEPTASRRRRFHPRTNNLIFSQLSFVSVAVAAAVVFRRRRRRYQIWSTQMIEPKKRTAGGLNGKKKESARFGSKGVYNARKEAALSRSTRSSLGTGLNNNLFP